MGLRRLVRITPMKSILDPSFRYTPSHATDVRRTFDRIRREAAGAIALRSNLLLVPSMPLALPRAQTSEEGRP